MFVSLAMRKWKDKKEREDYVLLFYDFKNALGVISDEALKETQPEGPSELNKHQYGHREMKSVGHVWMGMEGEDPAASKPKEKERHQRH